jgi:hypothetical protein
MTNQLHLCFSLSDEDADALKGKKVNEDHFDYLLGGADWDVFKPQDGSPLLLLRSQILPADLCRDARPSLVAAARPTLNRKTAAGHGDPVLSGVMGYFPRKVREPFCRPTAFTVEEAVKWKAVQPLIRAVDAVFKDKLPDRYAAQLDMVRRTDPAWVIHGTAFTTVTVNLNVQYAVHKDKGDLPQGFGVLTVIRDRDYDGGYLVFPKYRVAVDMDTRDVLLADVHEWHANTELGDGDRISAVFYYMTRMIDCGTPTEEEERLKARWPGDPLRD